MASGNSNSKAAEPSYWCHICYTVVPASEAATHQHDKPKGK